MAVAAISRVLAVNLGAVYEWVKKVRWALGILAWVTMQRQRWGIVPAISFDGMWTCQRARHGKKRREVWIWTAVIELPDGRRCVDFEVGDRSGETFCGDTSGCLKRNGTTAVTTGRMGAGCLRSGT